MKKVIPFKSTDREVGGSGNLAPRKQAPATDFTILGDAPEQQLLLLQRLIGCTDQEAIISRFFHWTRSLHLADGITFVPTAGDDISLGQRRHHSAQYDLNLDNYPMGKLTLCRRDRYSENELIVIEQALGSVARCLQAAAETTTLRELVTQDPLTGLGNRAALHEGIDRELSRSRRHHTPLAVMMIDVDHFKRLNDLLGHLGGDRVLKTIADVFKRSTRKSDLLFRFGGDEFTILMPHTEREGAVEAANQIRMNLDRLRAEEFGLGEVAEAIRPGLSIGIASYQPGDDEHTLLQRADTHLYHAKSRGRGRVCSNV